MVRAHVSELSPVGNVAGFVLARLLALCVHCLSVSHCPFIGVGLASGTGMGVVGEMLVASVVP